jgi:hypothetical protein
MKLITRRRIVDRMIVEKLSLGRGVQKTATDVGVGKRRIRETREKAIAYGYLDETGTKPGQVAMPLAPLPVFPDPKDGRSLRTSPQDELLTGKLDWVKERLIAGWSPITIYEELAVPGIGRSSFYLFLDRHSLHDLGKSHRADSLTPPIIHEPGEALILDWGKLRDVVDPVTSVQAEFPFYGYRRVHEWLERKRGVTINEKRILRIMKKYGLKALIWRGWKIKTTDADHNFGYTP